MVGKRETIVLAESAAAWSWSIRGAAEALFWIVDSIALLQPVLPAARDAVGQKREGREFAHKCTSGRTRYRQVCGGVTMLVWFAGASRKAKPDNGSGKVDRGESRED